MFATLLEDVEVETTLGDAALARAMVEIGRAAMATHGNG